MPLRRTHLRNASLSEFWFLTNRHPPPYFQSVLLRTQLRASLIVCILASASTAQAADAWLKVDSPHFKIVGNAEESQMRSIAAGLEAFLPALSEKFPDITPHATEAITIMVFKDETSFEPFRPEHDGVATSAVGYYLAGNDWNFVAAAAGAETQRILYHELFHALVQNQWTSLPAWAKEGLAEFYSTFDTEIGSVIPTHVATLRSRGWIPLRGLLAASDYSPIFSDPTRTDTFYAESWALIHYLQHSRESGREQLTRYFALRERGESLDASVQDAFHTGIADLEAELRQYTTRILRSSNPAALRMNSSQAAQVSPLSDAQASTYRGTLLLHLNRLAAAENQLQHAFEMDPANGAIHTALGALRLRQNRNADALALLARAVVVDSTNPLAHFYYATALQTPSSTNLQGRESPLKESREHLRKTIELAPWSTEAYRWLGYVSIALADGYDEAERALTKAIALEPARVELRDTLNAVKDADNTHQQLEQSRRERESRKQLSEALNLLRLKNPVPQVEPVVWNYPDAPPVKPRIVYPTLDGFLTMIDCREGLTLVLRSGERVVQFHTATPIKVEFTSKVSDAAKNAACGYVRPEHHVVVTYKKSASSAYLGEPIRIEYK